MITMADAYSWLNVGDHSHLSASNQLSIIQIGDKRIPPDHRMAVIRSLRTASESSRDIYETLEVKLALANLCFADDDLPAAKVDLQDAVTRYKPATHRLGVAKWMMGILLWRTRDNDAAYAFWSNAREIFVGLGSASVKES